MKELQHHSLFYVMQPQSKGGNEKKKKSLEK